MDLSIRNALPEDAETVYAMICRLEDSLLDKDYFMDCYVRNVNSPHVIYLLAFNATHAVGFLSCHGQSLLHHTGMVYEIQEMYVDEDYRGQRIGQRLIKELETLLEGRNCSSLEVTSNIARSKAHSFYLRNGFRQSHLKFTKVVK